jgi:membrane protein implicated in regulation of membrane protease activity
MMPAAEMRVAEAMTAEVATTMMPAAKVAAAMTAATMATTVTAAMTAAMTTAAVTTAALCQRRTCQQAGKRHRSNSNDRSQHLTLPRIRTSEASELGKNWNRLDCRKFRDRGAAGRATSAARSCRG